MALGSNSITALRPVRPDAAPSVKVYHDDAMCDPMRTTIIVNSQLGRAFLPVSLTEAKRTRVAALRAMPTQQRQPFLSMAPQRYDDTAPRSV